MRNMPWKSAILAVLEASDQPVHYADIAQEIIDKGYRTSVGATPAATVAAMISMELRSQVVRTSRGYYTLVANASDGLSTDVQAAAGIQDEVTEDAREMGLINAFGMFWRRSEVDWSGQAVKLLGAQQSGSQEVDFSKQAGIYLLYDANRVVYVGRVIEPRLGARLWEHTRDRLTGRWDRFSWFGVRAVQDDGALAPIPGSDIALTTLIATMEALLIEGLEPPQNRRQGDGFNALEFIQRSDPALERRRQRRLLDELGQRLG